MINTIPCRSFPVTIQGGGNDPWANVTFTSNQNNVPYTVAGGILDHPSITAEDSYGQTAAWNGIYHGPRIRVLSRWNYVGNNIPEDSDEVDIPKHFKGPTPVFEFFVTQPHIFVKGTYKIY
jgi:hypothetical protein